jgi:hypothetical protein
MTMKKRKLLLIVIVLLGIFSTGLSIGVELGRYSEWRQLAYESLSFHPQTSSNHSYGELLDFLENDTTNNASYSYFHDCKHFCFDFIRNATEYGFKCGFVAFQYNGGSNGHSVVVVNTEFGLIYVEPQSDDWHFFIDNISGVDIDRLREVTIVWSK